MKANKIIALITLSVLGLAGILFLATSSLYKKKSRALDITFPAPEYFPNSLGCFPNIITVILSKDRRVFYYEGGESAFFPHPPPIVYFRATKPDTIIYEEKIDLHETKLSLKNGIGDVISKFNSETERALLKLEEEKRIANMPDSVYQKKKNSIRLNSSAVTIYIKTDSGPKYGEVVELIDIIKLKKVAKFWTEEITQHELKVLNETLTKTPNQSKP
ncbi:MAG: hypothetical protein IAF38_01415 [Bacteroidia bacterium]|nr:hypothetical protein [Bacteroidia bacterium]